MEGCGPLDQLADRVSGPYSAAWLVSRLIRRSAATRPWSIACTTGSSSGSYDWSRSRFMTSATREGSADTATIRASATVRPRYTARNVGIGTSSCRVLSLSALGGAKGLYGGEKNYRGRSVVGTKRWRCCEALPEYEPASI